MSSPCPRGHQSEATDYCDVCGTPMTAPIFVAPAPPPPAAFDPSATAVSGVAVSAPGAAGLPCPACGAINPPGTTFCEDCGAIMDAPVPARAAAGIHPPSAASPDPTWEIVATADQAWYDTVHAEGIVFPAVYVDRRFTLTGDLVTIGRRSTRLGIYPDIDLAAAPEDIGVSRQHAVLRSTDEGTWALVDPGSANGTYLNDSDHPVPTNEAVPLADGDRIHVGAWTTITFRSVDGKS